MPLIASSFETLAADIKSAPSDTYVLFTGAKDENGKSWCPPCNAVAPDVKRVFEDSESNHAIAVYVKTSDFETGSWPQDEWAVIGVPMVYRLKDGKLSGASLMNARLGFTEALDAYVSGEDKYEAWLEKEQGDKYVDPATRGEWLHEDYARAEAEGKVHREREKARDEVRAAQAAKRKAAKADNGAEGANDSAEKEAPAGVVCNGTSCTV